MSPDTIQPRVSVIIPVYNGEATISRAIDSALAQKFDSFETIVVDDGSTDGTVRVLEGYGSSIKVVRQANRGPAAARNAGAGLGRGKYLAFLDADDEWLPQKLSRTVPALDANPDAVLAYSDFYSPDKDGRRLKNRAVTQPPCISQVFAEDWVVLPSTAVLARDVFERVGGFCEKFRRPGGEDPYLWLLAREQGPFVYVPEPLVIYQMPDAADISRKYGPGNELLFQLVHERYGRRALPLIRLGNRYRAAQLIASACSRLDGGDMRGGLTDLWRSLLLSPSHVLSGPVLKRILRPANLNRALKSLLRPRSSLGHL